MKTRLLIFVIFLWFVPAASPQVVTFSFNGASGDETTFAPDSQPVGATVGSVARGPGLTAASAADTFNAKAWTTSSSLDANDYYSFSITPAFGHQMSLSSLSLDERRSSTGIRSWSVRSSLDNFGSDLSLFSVPDNDLTRLGQTTLLGAEFQNQLSGVEFRLYGYGAESSAGTWRIDNMQLHGSVSLTAVPEPHEYALMASLGLLGFALYRRLSQKGIRPRVDLEASSAKGHA